MLINDLFSVVNDYVGDRRRRRRMHNVLRTVLRNRKAWNVDNDVRALRSARDYVASRLGTLHQVDALDDVLEMLPFSRPRAGFAGFAGVCARAAVVVGFFAVLAWMTAEPLMLFAGGVDGRDDSM